MDLLILQISYINGILLYITFCGKLLAFSIVFSSLTPVVAFLFFLLPGSISLYKCTIFIFLFVNWWTFGLFQSVAYYFATVNIYIQICVCGYVFLSYLGICLGVELLGPVVVLCLTSWWNSRPFPKVPAPCCIHMGCVWGLQCLHVPIHDSCYGLTFWL